MSSANDYSVRWNGASQEIRGVGPVGDRNAGGRGGVGNRKRPRRRKAQGGKPPPGAEPPEDLAGNAEAQPENDKDHPGPEHAVDHLA